MEFKPPQFYHHYILNCNWFYSTKNIRVASWCNRIKQIHKKYVGYCYGLFVGPNDPHIKILYNVFSVTSSDKSQAVYLILFKSATYRVHCGKVSSLKTFLQHCLVIKQKLNKAVHPLSQTNCSSCSTGIWYTFLTIFSRNCSL